MTPISPLWTLAERQAIINAKARQQIRILDKPRANLDDVYRLAEEIEELNMAVPAYLEENRRRLLEGIE